MIQDHCDSRGMFQKELVFRYPACGCCPFQNIRLIRGQKRIVTIDCKEDKMSTYQALGV